MAFIFDIIYVAIFIVCIILCSKKGFVRSVIEATGGMVAAFLAYILSKPVATWMCDKLIGPAVEESVSNALLEIEGTEVVKSATETIKSIDIGGLIEKAPQALRELLASLNVDLTTVQNVSAAQTTAEERAQNVLDTVCAPMAESIAICVSFILLFIILMIAVFLAARLAGLISHIPVIGKFNTSLGAIFGGLKGLVFVFIISAVLHLILPYVAQSLGLDPQNPFSNTLIGGFIDDINPIIRLLPEKLS